MANLRVFPPHNPKANVFTFKGFDTLKLTVSTIVFNSGFNRPGLDVVDLSRFVNVTQIEFGEKCFMNVGGLRLVGLRQLKSVVVGDNCFVKGRSIEKAPRYCFCVKDCPSLSELKTGSESFSGFTVCEIENVDALERVKLGENAFQCASLELKGLESLGG